MEKNLTKEVTKLLEGTLCNYDFSLRNYYLADLLGERRLHLVNSQMITYDIFGKIKFRIRDKETNKVHSVVIRIEVD